jgi:hypothetical protein
MLVSLPMTPNNSFAFDQAGESLTPRVLQFEGPIALAQDISNAPDFDMNVEGSIAFFQPWRCSH